ncbi:uncharacterized protein LOC122035071 isoform X2 [Zingiber officinale]|uniref:uncharacterized protein LOC122035071 isoform X2 n=1 Tax=Zingiber officinale TaxID=94328 RepID=UPI001C4B02A9|nr:uncharacterized protein LOC122035071 isoform X2 [Zingiber officinale]
MNRLKKEHMRDSSSRNSSSSNDTRRPSNYSRTSGDMNRFKKEHMRDSSSRNSSSSNDTRTPSNYSRTSFLHTLLLCKRHDGGFLLSKLQLFKRHEKAKQLQQDIISSNRTRALRNYSEMKSLSFRDSASENKSRMLGGFARDSSKDFLHGHYRSGPSENRSRPPFLYKK